LLQEEGGSLTGYGRKRSRASSTKLSAVDREEEPEQEPSQVKEEGHKHKKRGKKEKKFSWPIWRKLFDYTIRRKFLAFLGLLLSICFAMSVSLLPLKVGQLLDQITQTS
jgi:hypothetical protein